jgi:multiple sugar transport system substrate-binding protein
VNLPIIVVQQRSTMSINVLRTTVPAATAGLLALALAACSSSSGSGATASPGADGWTRAYQGTTLNVIGEATANSQIIAKLLPDFEAKTGIHVNLEQAPYDNLVQKAVLDFTTHKGNYDVLSIPYEYLGAFAEKKYLAPQDDFAKTPPTGLGTTFSTADLIPSLWKASSNWKDHWYGMPSNSAVMMMFYRKDLFGDADEQAAFKTKYGYDLAPAKTWQQYQDIAAFFTRPAGSKLAGQALAQPFYGVTLAGKRHVATVLEWMNYSWTRGGDLFDSAGQPAFNSTDNVDALSYEKGLTAYAPPGYTSATWDEVTAQLQQGVAAESITWGDTAGAMEDAAQSKVVAKMGYTDIPTQKAGDKPEAHLGSWTYAVNVDSKNQQADQVYMAWAMSKPVQLELANQGGLPALTSTFSDPGLGAKLPYWGQELTSLQQSRSRPRIPQWSGISDTLALAISQALSGQAAPKAALDDAQTKITSLMSGALPVQYQ